MTSNKKVEMAVEEVLQALLTAQRKEGAGIPLLAQTDAGGYRILSRKGTIYALGWKSVHLPEGVVGASETEGSEAHILISKALAQQPIEVCAGVLCIQLAEVYVGSAFGPIRKRMCAKRLAAAMRAGNPEFGDIPHTVGAIRKAMEGGK